MLICCQTLSCAATTPPTTTDPEQTLTTQERLSVHPRLLLFSEDIKGLKKAINKETCWIKAHDEILNFSDKIVTEHALPERGMEGRRLLTVSRNTLRSLFFLSYSYRMTGDKAFAKRCEEILLRVCGDDFPDWNPSHFLDVGEMALGVAIAYDWMYDYLSKDSREVVRTALVEKAINPSYDSRYNAFITGKSNWNQVCLTGVLYAAIAIYEDYPELAQQTIQRSLDNLYFGNYSSNGVYAEGVGYWAYGTSYVAMFISAVKKLYQNDFGMLSNKSLELTPSYAQSMFDPSGQIFNHSDSNTGSTRGIGAPYFWFAGEYNNPSLLWMQRDVLASNNLRMSSVRLGPAILIWSAHLRMKDITPPEDLCFFGEGEQSVATMRSSWTDSDALYFGIKAGRERASHAHMDVGSFIFNANGVRWAVDPGTADYNIFEQAGLHIWDYKQTSDRWKIYQYTNLAHNCLTFNGQLHNVGGAARIDKSSDTAELKYAQTDVSGIYQNQAKKVVRGIAIVNDEFGVVRDEVSCNNTDKIRWNMMTKASVEEINGNKVILKDKDTGRKLIVRIDSPADMEFSSAPMPQPNTWDTEFPDISQLQFEYTPSSADEEIVFQVSLIPYTTKDKNLNFNKSLNEW